MFQMLGGSALIAAAMTLAVAASTANAAEHFGFTLGMSQGDALALAKRNGYEFEPTPGSPDSYFQVGHGGPDFLSFCGSRLFAVGQTFDGDFPAFIGLVRERQARLGEPIWKVEQRLCERRAAITTVFNSESTMGRYGRAISA